MYFIVLIIQERNNSQHEYKSFEQSEFKENSILRNNGDITTNQLSIDSFSISSVPMVMPMDPKCRKQKCDINTNI